MGFITFFKSPNIKLTFGDDAADQILLTSVLNNETNECFYVQRTQLQISGQVSDGEKTGQAGTSSGLASGASPSQAGESRRQSVSSWVRSAQALLQTPPRTTDGQPKTPDDSGKKKPKFQRFDCFFYKSNSTTVFFLK